MLSPNQVKKIVNSLSSQKDENLDEKGGLYNDMKSINPFHFKCFGSIEPKVYQILGISKNVQESKEDYMRNQIYHKNLTSFGKKYLKFSMFCYDLVHLNDTYNNFITIVFIFSGLLVGVQTYDSMAENYVVIILNNFVLAVFALEILIKVCMEGLAPWRFLTGNDWKWNWFDITILMLSMPYNGNNSFGGGSIALLRLVRLARLGKLIKKIPALLMIVNGLIDGMKSISYIMFLLVLIFYIYGVIGFYLFSVNDPFHFGSLPLAMLTLFRVSLFDNWGDILYINYYGCRIYPDIYIVNSFNTKYSSLLNCEQSEAKPIFTTIYFVSFIIIAAFVILSLFIGSVTLSMAESMEELKKSASLKNRMAKFEENRKLIQEIAHVTTERIVNKVPFDIEGNDNSDNEEVKGVREEDEMDSNLGTVPTSPAVILCLSLWSRVMVLGRKIVERYREEWIKDRKNQMETDLRLAMGWQKHVKTATAVNISVSRRMRWAHASVSDAVDASKEDNLALFRQLSKRLSRFADVVSVQYAALSDMCKTVTRHPYFTHLITTIIILASINVGLESDDRVTANPLRRKILSVIEAVILALFTVEITLKVVAEGNRPLRYFNSRWNIFDFMIVVACFIPGVGSVVTLLRLLRLFRVLKLVRSLPQLAVISEALMNSMRSIGYVSLILSIFFYAFAIIGMMLFSVNDPWHFGTLHISLISLFRAATLDNWANLLYISIYGCDVYPDIYVLLPHLCTQPKALGAFAVMFHVVFVVINAQVLFSLFIGVISNSMEEARQSKRIELKLYKNILKRKTKYMLSETRIDAFRRVFDLFDLDEGGVVDETELLIGLNAIEILVTKQQAKQIFNKIDIRNEGIDFVQFIDFMTCLPNFTRESYNATEAFEKKKKEQEQRHQSPLYWLRDLLFGNSKDFLEAMELDAAVTIQYYWRKRMTHKKSLKSLVLRATRRQKEGSHTRKSSAKLLA